MTEGSNAAVRKYRVEKVLRATEEVQMNMRRSRFLLTTAVLLAGVSLASAQGMREGGGGGGGGGAAESGKSGGGKSGGGISQGAGGASRSEGMTQGRAAERAGGRAEGPAVQRGDGMKQRSEGVRESGRAAEKEQIGKEQQIGQDRSQRGPKEQTIGQGRGDRDQLRQSERKAQDKDQSYGKQKGQTLGQGRSERDQSRQSEQKAQEKQKPATAETTQQRRDKTGATTQGRKDQSTTTTGVNTKGSATTGANVKGQGQTAQQSQGTTTGANIRGQSTQSMSGRVSVTAQQQTRLQQSVLGSRNVTRVSASSINFRVNTGVVVPRHISVVSVSAFPVLIDLYPAYREDSFFVVDDEIIILDRSRRIVDVVPAGPRTRFSHAGGRGGGGVAALDLSPEEIRVVQEVLIERGLLIGKADGVFSTRTREALIVFQRRQGIQASGTIDTRTVAALGVSNKISATQGQQGQSTTVGQGRGGQQPSAQQNTTGQNTGQGRANAPAQQNEQTTGQAGKQQPAGQTTGQAGKQQPAGQTTGQAPAQGSKRPSSDQPSGQPGHNSPAPSEGGKSDQGGSGR
jgi:Putative peptidoglycan binding domain